MNPQIIQRRLFSRLTDISFQALLLGLNLVEAYRVVEVLVDLADLDDVSVQVHIPVQVLLLH